MIERVDINSRTDSIIGALFAAIRLASVPVALQSPLPDFATIRRFVRSLLTLSLCTMKPICQSFSKLFLMQDLTVRELDEMDLPMLQDFFVTNPEYFFAVNGMAPRADEARQEFLSRPPPEMPFNKVYVIGFFDTAGTLVAMTSIVSDFLAQGIWHIGLFIVATALHGTVRAASIYAGIEAWLRKQGARWIRLGVVVGNVRAEKFWEKSGFNEVRRRADMQFGSCTHTVRVLVKPVAASGLDEYLLLAARDRPESGLV